jgi:putative two-component system hydrogenase maturation factor HypX/HoxX
MPTAAVSRKPESAMRILLLSSAHNSLGQRVQVELEEAGHAVTVQVADTVAAMVAAVRRDRPELIIAPMLKTAIPEEIWRTVRCLIVHPGIVGDRGPSSLDWAIRDGASEWGVTVLQAGAVFDAGDVWASETFPMRVASKSRLYRRDVADAALRAVHVAVRRVARRDYVPVTLDYSQPDVLGRPRPPMRPADRAVDWTASVATVLRQIHCSDSAPGAPAELAGRRLSLFGAHREPRLAGAAGSVIARRDGAVCVGCGDGAVWITHARERGGIKLPLADVLRVSSGPVPDLPIAPELAGSGNGWSEIRYREKDAVGYVSFDFYNGAMSTARCERLLRAYRFAQNRPTRAIVLLGGDDLWSY